MHNMLEYTEVKIDTSKSLNTYVGALRQEWNNRHFNSRNKKSEKYLDAILTNEDINNIRKASNSKNYFKALKNRTTISVKDFGSIERDLIIRGNTCILRQNKYSLKVNMKKTLKNTSENIKYKGFFFESNGTIKLYIRSIKLNKPIVKKISNRDFKRTESVIVSYRESEESNELFSKMNIKISDKCSHRAKNRLGTSFLADTYSLLKNNSKVINIFNTYGISYEKQVVISDMYKNISVRDLESLFKELEILEELEDNYEFLSSIYNYIRK